MRKLIIIFLLFNCKLSAQEKYWQQQLNYTIDVQLDDKEKSITGFETIVYKNNSPNSIDFIWFHLYPNAYKNNKTALFRQIDNDSTLRYYRVKKPYGYITELSFTVNGIPATVKPHPKKQYIDIVKLILPKPLLSGDSVTISTPFKVYLPAYFSRMGYTKKQFIICQWYPKPAVFDKDGWHQMPNLNIGEYYSEYATYTVNITTPSDYTIAATGTLQTTSEVNEYKRIGTYNKDDKNNSPIIYKPIDTNKTKTLTYTINNVPDFAWVASKDLVIQYDTLQLPSNKVVDVFTYYFNKKNSKWKNSVDYVKDATLSYSKWIGEYDYPIVQAVEESGTFFSEGMEYPTLALIGNSGSDKRGLDAVIAHEVGHNWFMSILGNNEREHAWLDEGVNTYFQYRYEAEKYRYNYFNNLSLSNFASNKSAESFLDALYVSLSKIPMNSAIEKPSYKFSNSYEYFLSTYQKAALWLFLIEKQIGRESFDKAFQIYYNKWKFKHTQPSDLQAAFEEATNTDFTEVFELLNKQGFLTE